MVEADETMPPSEFPAGSAWVKVKTPAPVQYALIEAGKAWTTQASLSIR